MQSLLRRLLQRSYVQVILGAIALLAVVALNGRPSVFTDTDDYYAQGRGAAHAVKPVVQAIVRPILHAWGADDDADYRAAAADEDHTSMAARSPYYGIFLYGTYRIGGLWLTATLQALACAFTLFALMRGLFGRPTPLAYLGVMVFVAAATTLPFFAGFAMPDVLAALGAAATVALALFWDGYSRAERFGLVGVILGSLWSHTSHILLEILLIVALVPLYWLTRVKLRDGALRLGLLLACIVSAIGSDMAYHQVVLMRTGEDLHRPPFLTARVLADGPGRLWLRQACQHANPYVLCAYKRDPLDNSDEILWADDPARGIFNASKIKTRILLDEEEKSFVIAAVTHYPVEQLAASLSNWWDQLNMVDLAEPLRDPGYYFTNVYWRDTSLPGLIPGGKACLKQPKLCRPQLNVITLWWWHRGVILASLAFLLWRLTRPDMVSALLSRDPAPPGGRRAFLAATALILYALLVNSAVTGILSGPFSRYNSRIIWLAPALAAMLLGAFGPGFDYKGLIARVKLRG